MTPITPEMARIDGPALRWYAELLASGKREFLLAEFGLPERTLRHYIRQVRDCGWCAIRVVRQGRGGAATVYGLPSGSGSEAEAAAAEFCRRWGERAEAARLPFAPSDYESLLANFPPMERAPFERALLSKLIEAAGNPQVAGARPSRRLGWLRAGLGMALRSAQWSGPQPASAAAPPKGPAPNPDEMPEWRKRELEEYKRQYAAWLKRDQAHRAAVEAARAEAAGKGPAAVPPAASLPPSAN